MLVGLTGYAGSGKDTAAALLLRMGWTRVAFADPLKDVARQVGWDGQKNRAGRELLQNLGAAVRDLIDPDAWVTAAARTIDQIPGPVIITDVRYPNEAAWIRAQGGLLVLIDRPGVGPANDHASERIEALPVDFAIVNDQDREVLAERLAAAVLVADLVPDPLLG